MQDEKEFWRVARDVEMVDMIRRYDYIEAEVDYGCIGFVLLV